MQHRVQVGQRFYSVTVVEEAEREWLAFAEIDAVMIVEIGSTAADAIARWQNAARLVAKSR
jgi:hypothetical protein